MANAKKDDNNVSTLIAVSNVDGSTPVPLYADPTTHRLLVSSVAGALDDLTDVVITTGAQGDILYNNGTSWVNLPAGASGELLKTQGAGANPIWASGGGGDVSKVGTPVDNQVGVWTGDGTIEGTAGLTYDGVNFLLTGDIGSTGTRITKGWFTDLEVTNAIAGDITGNAGTVTSIAGHTADAVSTITGLAPDTATTQATQPNITSLGTLTGLTMGGVLAMGVNNITMTGTLGLTGSRLTKGWFTDLEVTGAIVGSVTGNAGTVTSGVYTTDNLSALSATTSLQLKGVISDETGSGALVFATSPTLVTPVLGTPASGDLSNCTSYPINIVDDTTPQLGGDLDAQANHIGFTQQTITYNATTTTVDWGAGNKATVTLTGNVGTMAFTNPPKPSNLVLKIVQDATGSRVVTAWDADIKWAGGTAPTLTTTASGIDIVSFYWDGTNYFGVASLDFS